MKRPNPSPRLETLEDRALLSASPLGDLTALLPEVSPTGMLLPAVQKVREAAARMGQEASLDLSGTPDNEPTAGTSGGGGAGKVQMRDFSFISPSNAAPAQAIDVVFSGIPDEAAGKSARRIDAVIYS